MADAGDYLRDAVNSGRHNVRYYGAKGDSTTDDSAAIQRAVDACDANRGGTVYFPQGRYKINTGITVTYQGTRLRGQGMPGTSRSQASGSSRIDVADGITAFTCNSGSSPSHLTLGFGFENLHIRAVTGSTTGNGILVQNAERTLINNVTVSDFIGGYGLRIDGKTGNAQYAELYNFSAGDCLTGLHTQGTSPNSIRLFGGYFQGSGTDPRDGSTGIHVTTGDTLRLFGTVVQGYETGAYIASAGAGHELYGPRFEYCNICLRIGATVNDFSLFGGAFTNSILTGSGSNIGIQVDSGAADVLLMPTTMAGLTTHVTDNGTRTRLPSGLGVTSAATVLGSVAYKVPLYNAIGTVIGYVPVYDAIT